MVGQLVVTVKARRAAFCAARMSSAGKATVGGSSRGVSDPPRLPPMLVPRPERGGSLTPRLLCPVVRMHVPPHASSFRHRARPWSWPPARRAPRLEMVTTVTHRFLEGRAPCR